MAFSRSDLRIIYIALKLFGSEIPYEDEVDEIITRCKDIFTLDEQHELDEEIDSILQESQRVRNFTGREPGD